MRPTSSPAGAFSSASAAARPSRSSTAGAISATRPRRARPTPTWRRRHAEVFLDVLRGKGFAQPNPRPMFPNPPGLLRLEPHSEGLRDRIWWGAATNATAVWAAKLGMNLQSSTLKFDESGKPFHIQQAEQIRDVTAPPGRRPDIRASRGCRSAAASSRWSTIATAPISAAATDEDQYRLHRARSSGVFGRSYAAEPDVLIEQLKEDEAIAEADTLLLDRPEPARRRLQRARHRGDPDPCRPGPGLAVTTAGYNRLKRPDVSHGISRSADLPLSALGETAVRTANSLPDRAQIRTGYPLACHRLFKQRPKPRTTAVQVHPFDGSAAIASC